MYERFMKNVREILVCSKSMLKNNLKKIEIEKQNECGGKIILF